MSNPAMDGCIVLKARRIYDLGGAGGRWCRSAAIRDGRIVTSSAHPDDLDALAGPSGGVLDARDLTFLPGFFDAHAHFLWGGLDLTESIAAGGATLGEFVASIRSAAAQRPAGEWILTSRVWDERRLAEARLPTAAELDRASEAHPILVRRGGNVIVANSLAMRLAGITRESPDPEGGQMRRDADGMPNGQFVGPSAIQLVIDHVPATTLEARAAGARAAGLLFAAAGTTTVRDVGVYRDDMLAYHIASQRGWLPIRARVGLRLDPASTTEQQLTELRGWPVSSGFGDDRLRVDAICIVVDNMHAAATSATYVRDPDFRGTLYASAGMLSEVIGAAVDRGWRIACTAFGDRAVEEVLSVYEEVKRARPGLAAGSLAFDHALFASEAQRERAAALGAGVTLTYHAIFELSETMRDLWGAEVAGSALPVGAWAQVTDRLCAGSAYQGGQPANPLLAVWGMVTRKARSGAEQGAQHAVSREKALEIATIGGRRAFDGNLNSALASGQLADLVGYHADPLACPIDELAQLLPAMTIVGGTIVHQATT